MKDRKSILVTGGAGFLGSHLCDRLLEAGPRRALRRQLLHRHQAQHRAPARPSALRADAPRRDLPALRRGRRDLQSRLPGLADPLPARPGADDQDQSVHGAINMLGLAKRLQVPHLPGLDQRGLRRPGRASADRRATGATSIRSARAPATTRASAAPRRCSSTITASTSCEIKVARIFNTYGPRMHPNDGRVVSNFIVQALQGRADHHLRRRQPDPLVLLRRRPDRRLDAADGQPGRAAPARSTSAIPASSPSASWPRR